MLKKVIIVLSNKGGVGKSSVTVQLALSLRDKKYNVGILDTDLTGPSIPRMFNVESQEIFQVTKGWEPITVYKADEKNQTGFLKIVSIGFLLKSREDSVVWRGPKKTGLIRQFMQNVVWTDGDTENVDYLLIDTPPGTSDEHIAVIEELKNMELKGCAILVTTPQEISTNDVVKSLDFCRKSDIEVLGVIENMSGFVCPDCSECTDIFSNGGGKKISDEFGLNFLGSLPIDPYFVEILESQGSGIYKDKNLMDLYKNSSLKLRINEIINQISN